ncbi:MAG TPA: ATP-binding protein [Rubricoccaceae bacterium]|jgi:anti-sigma regulatory factor (Ser/Thr protein kinase)
MPGFTLAPGVSLSALAEGLSALERDLAGVPAALADRVLIVAGEVAANAAEHGHGTLRVRWTVTQDAVTLDLIGPGPDARTVRAATLPEDVATRGRGLYLIRTLATSVEDVPGGLRVRLRVGDNGPLLRPKP